MKRLLLLFPFLLVACSNNLNKAIQEDYQSNIRLYSAVVYGDANLYGIGLSKEQEVERCAENMLFESKRYSEKNLVEWYQSKKD